MPTVLRFFGYRVVIYPNDHRPEHVYVIGKGVEAVFEMNCPDGRIGLRENYGIGRVEVRRIKLELKRQQRVICEAWEAIHGR